MRLLMLTVVGFLFISSPATGSSCLIHENGTTEGNCAFIDKIQIGKTTIKITDPEALLEAAKKKQVTRVVKSSLWDIYEFPPVLQELARQNDVSVEELVSHLAESWREDLFNPFKALQELPDALSQLEKVIGPEQSDKVLEELIRIIIDDLNLEIKKGLEV